MSPGRAARLVLKATHTLFLGAVVLYMILPSVVVIALSFSNDSFIAFPPGEWGFRQYGALFGEDTWLAPFVRSLLIACASALLAVVIGSAAVLALYRTAIRGKNLIQFLGVGPLLVPGVAYAIALYSLFSSLGMLGTTQALILAHTTLALPFVLLIMGAAISRVPPEMELAAMSLGASRFQAWRDITFRFLLPATIASLIFAFITSFDEAVLSSFLVGAGYETLPVAIFNSIRFGVDPVITAISSLLTAGTGALLVAYALLRRGAE